MGVSMHFVISSAPALHDELQCIHNLTMPPGFLTGDGQYGNWPHWSRQRYNDSAGRNGSGTEARVVQSKTKYKRDAELAEAAATARVH
jgi:hypothetical protein